VLEHRQGGVLSLLAFRLHADLAFRKRLLLWTAGIGIDGIILTSAIFTGTVFIFAPDLADGIGSAGLVLTMATLPRWPWSRWRSQFWLTQ
jgi:hypothetical protein